MITQALAGKAESAQDDLNRLYLGTLAVLEQKTQKNEDHSSSSEKPQ